MINWIHALPLLDDRVDRRKALKHATRQLDKVQAQDDEITSMAESIQHHVERNHFIERLEAAYGIRR